MLRLNHLLIGLLGLSGAFAFVLPAGAGNAVRSSLQLIFAPVSSISARIGASAQQKINPDKSDTETGAKDRTYQQIVAENAQLRLMVADLNNQLEKLGDRAQRINKLGVLVQSCISFGAVGADAGGRESLNLTGSSFQGLKTGMAVLDEDGNLVGQVQRAGIGATVRLVTDRNFRFLGAFARMSPATDSKRPEYQRIATNDAAVLGMGNGQMLIQNLETRQVTEAGVRADDWVMLRDHDWAPQVQWVRVGRVVSVAQRRDAPGFAEIRVEPLRNLMSLRDLLVVAK